MHPKYLLENWTTLIFAIAMFVVCVLCFVFPDALADADARGRRAAVKALVIWLWG